MSSGTVVKRYSFNETRVKTLIDDQEINWPVVYQIYDNAKLYVGETTCLQSRMLEHLDNTEKAQMTKFSVVFDKTYNKSVTLDLESQLIQWFSGDGKYKMLNRNDGIASHKYYDRDKYRQDFANIWIKLQEIGIARRTITDIENSGLFKFSPYKELNEDQLNVVQNILTDMDEAFTQGNRTVSIISGKEGTGKTIVIMYLIKLIRDIQDFRDGDDVEPEQEFDPFFSEPFRSRFKNKTMAVVIPNTSLRGSVQKIFKSISNLSNGCVDILSPIQLGKTNKVYDITLIDEAHLLKRSGWSQQSAKVAIEISQQYFDGELSTELDWVLKKSRNVVMVFGDQRVRPTHITKESIFASAKVDDHFVREYPLKSQMRSRGGEFYIDYLQHVLSDSPPANMQNFDDFEFKIYDDFSRFVNDIREREQEFGLCRLVAGFAWKWASKGSSPTSSICDIEIDGIKLKWNSTDNDWIGSVQSTEEVGSIYTIQGFDLNYCGVIVGNDLRYDQVRKKLIIDRGNYFDIGAKKRSKQQIEANVELSDEELLEQITRIYRILMNRSIRGTYVYVCDRNLREYLSRYIEKA